LLIDEQYLTVPDGCRILLPRAPQYKLKPPYAAQIDEFWYETKNIYKPHGERVDNAYFAQHFYQETIQESTRLITTLIESEAKELGDPSKVFLAGFARGSCIALTSFL
jgi:predicted esterase